jgi:hypothetical protein
MGQHFPDALPHISINELRANSFVTSKSLTLLNGDSCGIGQWVLARQTGSEVPGIFCIQEIINRIGTENMKQL